MTSTKHSGFEKLAEETKLYPQEQLATIATRRQALFIGIPKEVSLQENRISLTPEAVSLVVKNGHNILVERGAGDKS